MSARNLTKEASPERVTRGERTARKARGTVLECARYDERTSRAPILSYKQNRLEALWIRKRGYLDNGCAEFYKIDVPRKGSASRMNDPKSERRDAELRERLWQDLEDGPSHKNANISGATGSIRTILTPTWST
ncbi:hypothetical protein M404DRAFT_991521, partial [Pisolithus tinctorius Marx 270]